MSSFENRLAHLLADDSRPPDEAFVAKMAHLVGAEERARRIRLSIATIIALVLAGVFCYGLALAWRALSPASISSQDTIEVAATFVCILAFIVAFPLAFARE